VATRAYLDTNLYISYLLNPFGKGPPTTIVDAGFEHRFSMVFGTPTVDEILRKVTTKSYLSSRIPTEQAEEFLWLLHQLGELIEDAPPVIPAISRDRNDDYLLAYSGIARVDFLVSGDHDLLELREFEAVRIVSPAEFVAILDQLDQ
jgi:putative PIN family toxin of toxin-antitoxin system